MAATKTREQGDEGTGDEGDEDKRARGLGCHENRGGHEGTGAWAFPLSRGIRGDSTKHSGPAP